MYDSAADLSRAPEIPDPLARADALERDITDLCAHINAAGYRLLQLIAELDDEAPWGAWGPPGVQYCTPGAARTGSTGAAASVSTRRGKRSASRTRSSPYRGLPPVLPAANSAFPRYGP